MTNETQTQQGREEERILRLDEALELIPFLAKEYTTDTRFHNYRFLDTAELLKISHVAGINAEPSKENAPKIVGQFLAVRKVSKNILESREIISYAGGFFYQSLDALFNHQGFLRGWGKLKSSLDHGTCYRLKEPTQIRLDTGGQIVCEEDTPYFIDDQLRKSYLKNRGLDVEDKRLEQIGVQLPLSRNWTLGTFALEPRNPWTATISEASPEQQIVLRYSGEPLENALMRVHIQPKDVGNGVYTFPEDRIPKYLKRTLWLGGQK